jgi:hypothetical protein
MKLLILASIALAGTLAAGTITHSNTCSITTTIDATGQSTTSTVTGTWVCQASTPYLFGQIHANGMTEATGSEVTLSANGFYETPRVDILQHAVSDRDGVAAYRSEVMSVISFSEWLRTDGPPRQGFIQVFASYYRDLYEERGGPTVTVGGVPNTPNFPDQDCPVCPLLMVPFQLGGDFELLFTYSMNFTAAALRNEGNIVSGLGGFRLFEADGITPVAAFVTEPVATPEPSTVIATALGLVGVAFLRRRR